MSEKKQMKVTLLKGLGGRLKSHQACVRGLGIRKIHNSVIVEDTPATRGMLNKVSYMVRVEEVDNAS